ncbi:SDR family NAD(P)-dependent oxidoreductase [Streptosporangium sp. NPDC087985]|uniref:ABC transporter ATP-binding protein n=1 Tax=Streptosporangium sp. NPDC087985 TaxID=3366196 RepID=UPI003810815E
MTTTAGWFDGQVAVVTGGASGIGRAAAVRLMNDGACVVLVDRDADALAATRGEIGAAAAIVADVSDEESVRNYVRQTMLNGAEIIGPPREVVLVFQDYSRSLYPWLTVSDNVAMPLKANQETRKALSAADRKTRVAEALEAVGLAAAGNKYPWQLSGGMQQRVALARAVAFRPEILLLDEPFASVDALVREELEDLVLRLRQRLGVTVVLVTHDIDEAVYLSDRVFVLGPPPSVVVREVRVPLPRPRVQVETRSSGEFLELRNIIHAEIMRRPQKEDDDADVR